MITTSPPALALRCGPCPCAAQRPLFDARPDPASDDASSSGSSALPALQRSFVTALPHAQAATLALIELPPAGIEPVNPVQALQVWLTRELARTDICARLRRLAQPLGDAPLACDLHRFAAALLPRLIEARRSNDADALRQAMQDAWAQPLVHKLWQRFALPLGARRARTLLRHAQRLDNGMPGIERFRQTPQPPGSRRRPARRRATTALPRD